MYYCVDTGAPGSSPYTLSSPSNLVLCLFFYFSLYLSCNLYILFRSQELLDDNGILPILSDATAGGNASLASLVESLSDTILPVNYGLHMVPGGNGNGAGPEGLGQAAVLPIHKDSWERGEAISTDPAERHQRVETGVGVGAFGDREEVDEVDVIMQVRQRPGGRRGR